MKKSLLMLAVVLAPVSSFASVTQFNTNVTLTPDITVTETTPVSFGSIQFDSASNAIITLDAATGASTSNQGKTATGATAGAFTIAGTGNNVVNLSIAPSTVSNAANTVTLNVALSPDQPTVTLASGAGTFKVGGTVTVPSGTVAEAFTGTYQITATY